VCLEIVVMECSFPSEICSFATVQNTHGQEDYVVQLTVGFCLIVVLGTTWLLHVIGNFCMECAFS